MALDRLLCLGVDHHQSPIALRERMAIAGADLPDLFEHLTALDGIDGVVILSTCNRSEVYVSGDRTGDVLLQDLAKRQGIALADLNQVSYSYAGQDALRHLFRVAASLESMVVGEYQIMHQVKYAYEQAHLHRCTTRDLNRAFQRALAVGKEVRTRTGIGKYKLSIASIAVDLARQIHGELDQVHLLVIGAGEMADLSLQHFVEHGVRRMTIINRNQQRAEELAERLLSADVEVQIKHWNQLSNCLDEHDIILSSTAAPVPIIRREDVRRAMTRRRDPLMLIDLAVPRDIDEEVANVDDAYLFNVDSLEAVVARNRRLREDEIASVDAIVEERLQECLRENSNDIGEIRQQVIALFDDIVQQESERLQKKLQLDDIEELAYGVSRVGKKFQHLMLDWLRRHADEEGASDLVRDILQLPEDRE